jgi:molybdate transport system substrate-binding protein
VQWGMAEMAEINVLCSGAFRAAFIALAPELESATGHKLATTWGASVGSSANSIPRRLERGEPADLVIMAGDALDRLVAQGRIVAGSRTDLASTGIAMAVRAGAPKPDIGSAAALEQALLRVGSIAISTSASGVYLRGLFQRLGIADALAPKLKVAEGEPAGKLVARGEAEIGFQQMSELLPVRGIDIVGPLPPEIQETTLFAAGIAAAAQNADAARALVQFLTAPAAAAVIRRHGMEPA